MNKKKTTHPTGWLFVLLAVAALLSACDDGETYADKKKKERRAISEFIADNDIKVISFKEFCANDSTTDVEQNEYVLFEDKGVYMQIVNNPKEVGYKLQEGDNKVMLARFLEYNIEDGDTLIHNLYDISTPDVFMVSLSNGNYTGTFTEGYMNSYYGSSVPTGWLIPFPYIYLTRRQSMLAKVNLIVPHSQGTSQASNYVYPCFYSITLQPDSNQ